jgi:hypothetical protein
MGRKCVLSISSLLAGLALLTSCNRPISETRVAAEGSRSRTSDSAVKPAFVRFVNVYSDATLADFYAGDRRLFNGVSDQTVTAYEPLQPQIIQFSIAEGGKPDRPLATQTEELSGGKYYSLLAYDDGKGRPVLRIVKDDVKASSSGKSRVRIIPASGLGFVEIYAGGRREKLASEDGSAGTSQWQEVDPVDTHIEVRTSDEQDGFVLLPRIELKGYKSYTFVVSGGHKAGRKLQALAIVEGRGKT